MKKKLDVPLIITIFIICIYGIIMIYSASSIWAEYKFNDKFHYVIMQSIFFLVGIILMFIVSKIPYTYYLKKSNLILLICFILLILVLIPGIGSVRNGSRSWFGIGGLGIQPSEFMKLGLIIFTSKYIYNNPKDMRSVKKGALPILLIVMSAFLLIMLQPDFGTGTILVMTIIGMLFISGVNFSFFIKIGMVGIVGVCLLIIAAPYRMERIVSFLNPWSDPLGTGFQAIQSLYAIGPGGLFGRRWYRSFHQLCHSGVGELGGYRQPSECPNSPGVFPGGAGKDLPRQFPSPGADAVNRHWRPRTRAVRGFSCFGPGAFLPAAVVVH